VAEKGQISGLGGLSISNSSGEESDTSDEESSELAERHSEIQDTITHLYRLSFKIRNANHRLASVKALSMKNLDEETGEDLFSGYARYDYRHILESLRQIRHIPQPVSPSLQPVRERDDDIPIFLLDRLSRAITNRRRYFAYWQRHALRLSRIVDEPAIRQKNSDISKELLGKLVTESPDRNQFNANVQTQTNLIPIAEPKSIISSTDVSKYHGNLDDHLDAQTVISYATTAKDVDGHSVDLPSPPVISPSQSEFICPYCWVTCPSRQGKGKLWR